MRRKAKKDMKTDVKSVVLAVLGTMAGAFFLLYVIFAPYMASENECKKVRIEFQQKLDSVYDVLNGLRKTDTLLTDMADTCAYNIEVLEKQDSVISSQLNGLKRKVSDLDAELDSYD